jgi:hypothetical protein
MKPTRYTPTTWEAAILDQLVGDYIVSHAESPHSEALKELQRNLHDAHRVPERRKYNWTDLKQSLPMTFLLLGAVAALFIGINEGVFYVIGAGVGIWAFSP